MTDKKNARFAALVMGASAAIVINATPSAAQAVASQVQTSIVRKFPICKGSKRVTCIVDGDTIWLDGVKIRVADIDTPEIGNPKCQSERKLGLQAKDRLRVLLNSGPFDLHAWENRDEDQYGRKLRVLVRDGRSIGDQLVEEGLARTWSGRREPWC